MSTHAGEGTAWTGGDSDSERQKDISHWCGAMAEMAEVLMISDSHLKDAQLECQPCYIYRQFVWIARKSCISRKVPGEVKKSLSAECLGFCTGSGIVCEHGRLNLACGVPALMPKHVHCTCPLAMEHDRREE